MKKGLIIDLVNDGNSWFKSPKINDYFVSFTKDVKFYDIEDVTVENSELLIFRKIGVAFM